MEKEWVEIRRRINGQEYDYGRLADFYHISPLAARVMINRKVEDFAEYLDDGKFHMPLAIKDMNKGVQIMLQAIRNKEQICVIGDYDIDGVNAAYILKKGIERCGGNVSVRLPHRVKDGYGMNIRMVREAAASGIGTIITCDNGIAAQEAVIEAKQRGIKVIITDHHEIPYKEESGNRRYILPKAEAIIDPHRADDDYPYKELCGAGVAWKFIQMLYRACGLPVSEADVFLENVAFATIGDIVELTGENRAIVKRGLERLGQTQNAGMRALLKETGIYGKTIEPYHVGFVLGPCINAAGRLETADLALELLCAETEKEAHEMAEYLVSLNRKRIGMTEEGTREAEEAVSEMPDDRVLVIHLPGLHESIAGIVAGRIKEKYNRPVFVITGDKEIVKGSGRSVEGYSMYEEMNRIGDVFEKFGGHPMAAGFSLCRDKIPEMRQRLNEKCRMVFVPKVRIDAHVPVSAIDSDMIRSLDVLKPFGKGNEKPLFGDIGVQIDKITIVGRNENVLKLSVHAAGGKAVEAVLFYDKERFLNNIREKYPAEELELAFQGKENQIRLSLAYEMNNNEYGGRVTPQLVVKEYKIL